MPKRITSQELKFILEKNKDISSEDITPAEQEPQTTPQKTQKKWKRKTSPIHDILQKPKRSQIQDPTHGMNQTEKKLAKELEIEKLLGNILGFHFEKIGLQIAPKTWYFPDFVVYMPDGSMHIIEVKGFLRDDAAAKYKVAVGLFPEITFHMIKRENSTWKEMYNSLLEPPIKTDGKNCRITLR